MKKVLLFREWMPPRLTPHEPPLAIMKFVLAIEKKNSANIGNVEGHNTRSHPTKSQLPKSSWFAPEPRYQVSAFNAELLEKSRGLAKRKDAVLAVELVIQVGNQTDWRELPTKEYPHGKPKDDAAKRMNALANGARDAAIAEFGSDRIISIDLHTDESTPHVHVVFAPINEGKLQAKHWLNGAASCALLREKIHSHVAKRIDCDYEKGAPGGDPHDASKAAGGPNAPKPAPGLIEKATEKITRVRLVDQLKSKINDLNKEIQTMFSRLKNAEKRAADETALREKAVQAMREKHALTIQQQEEIEKLRQKVEDLTPKKEDKKRGVNASFIEVLKVNPTEPLSKSRRKITEPR